MSELDDSFKPENMKKKVSSEKEYLDRFQRTVPTIKRPMPVKKPTTSVTNGCDRADKVIKTPVNEADKESPVIESAHTPEKVTNNEKDMSLEMVILFVFLLQVYRINLLLIKVHFCRMMIRTLVWLKWME